MKNATQYTYMKEHFVDRVRRILMDRGYSYDEAHQIATREEEGIDCMANMLWRAALNTADRYKEQPFWKRLRLELMMRGSSEPNATRVAKEIEERIEPTSIPDSVVYDIARSYEKGELARQKLEKASQV